MRITTSENLKVNKAKQLLSEAMGQLLEKKRLEKITVSELLHQTGLSRSSFYYNFESKYALYLWRANQELKSALERIGSEVSWIENMKNKMKNIAGDQRNYREALTHDSQLEYEINVEHIRELVGRYRYIDEETEFAIRFFVAGQLKCFGDWLRGGCKTPIDKLVTYMVHAAPQIFQEYLTKKGR